MPAQLARPRPPDPLRSASSLPVWFPCPHKGWEASLRPLGLEGRLEALRLRHMCRIFGCVAAEPMSLRHELLEAENPLIRQSEHHDSGWGMAVYERPTATSRALRFPQAAHEAGELERASEREGRIFNVHVRRATLGGLTPVNTHPFAMGNYTFGHNGTVIAYPRLLEPGVAGSGRRDRLRGHLQLPDALLRPRRRARLAAASDVGGGGPLRVLRAELPVLRRRAPVRLQARDLQPALAGQARPAAGGIGAGHRASAGTRSPRTCC